MNMRKTRKLVSIILEVFIALGVLVLMYSAVMNTAFASKDSFIEAFDNDELVLECTSQLDEKYAVLAKESGIPKRVFDTVKTTFPVKDALKSAAESVFNEENSDLYSQTRVDYFYDLCCEYLDGNEIKYNKEDVRNTAIKAAEIYSDTVGLHDVEDVETTLSDTRNRFNKEIVVSSLLIAGGVFGILIMYKTKKNGFYHAIGGALAGSIAGMVSSAFAIVASAGSHTGITPEAYKNVFAKDEREALMSLFLLSAIVLSSSVFSLVMVKRKVKDKS